MKIDNINDEALRLFLKKSLRQAPPSPWFTKKVMNRLPEQNRSVIAWIEYAIYLIATITAIVFLIKAYGAMINSQVITVGNVMSCILYGAVAISAGILFCYPWLVQLAQNSLKNNSENISD